jgi:hypothetical protein
VKLRSSAPTAVKHPDRLEVISATAPPLNSLSSQQRKGAPMRPLVFKCPHTSVDVIINLRAHERAQLLVRNSPFAFRCSCCAQMHLWRLRDANHVRRSCACTI